LAKEITRVRYRAVRRVVLFVVVCGLAAYLGCAAPKPCTVTPVDIEEINSDIRDLSTVLAERKGVLSKVEADVAALKVEVEEKRSQIPALRVELERLEKASGRTERLEPETAASGTGSGE
jgi:septal ring factor EnvC (AmiA/AmiB activator)